MSAAPTPNDSPLGTPIQPLHNPSQAAHVVVPQATLGIGLNSVPGMGSKALLAKKLAKAHNPSFISPTDNVMTPCTQKLNAAKKKQFAKGPKPVKLFDGNPDVEASNGKESSKVQRDGPDAVLARDDDNPFR